MKPELIRAAEMVRKGASYGEAAKALGLTRSQVAGACTRAGVRTGRPNGRVGNGAAVVALYLEGVPVAEIARRCGLSSCTGIWRYLQRAGVKSNRYKRRSSVEISP